MRRLREGYCLVANPFDPRCLARVSLTPEEVESFVFWTRYPRPLLRHLSELDALGCRYYFLFTLLDYPPMLEPHCPPLAARLHSFHELSARLGADRVIWRYDPILLSTLTGADFHRRAFGRLVRALEGRTRRCVVSLLDEYGKVRRRLQALAGRGLRLLRPQGDPAGTEALLRDLAAMAAAAGIQVVSCAEEEPALGRCGIPRGSCVDAGLVERLFGVRVDPRKDPGQRRACRCAVSRDIGAYDTCGFGCLYCYATSSPQRAQAALASADPDSPSLPAAPARPAAAPRRRGASQSAAPQAIVDSRL